jgi:hypothetical protein
MKNSFDMFFFLLTEKKEGKPKALFCIEKCNNGSGRKQGWGGKNAIEHK